MFDKDALQLLIATALAGANQTLETGGHKLALLPETIRPLNLEQYQANRDRFRGTLRTHSLADFAGYVERHTTNEPKPAGFVDQDAMSATVIFNLGTDAQPGHGDDTATLTLKPTAAYVALQGIVGKPLSQQALAEFLEDWMPHLVAGAGDESLPMLAAINAVRRMSIKASSTRDSEVGDLSARRSAMDEIEARSLETMPTTFIFTTRPYEPLEPASITLRVSVITGRDDPQLKLRWVGEEAQREGFADEFKRVLDSAVGGLVPLTIGTYQQGK
ncbi:DUF2303 family protein [Pseudomonas anguilliseptica]|uniref:Uncharacterized conserved protein YfdQ, DUF2303 family n=1 Tax=Pseudomonas anguilliseptica TaxID=53406 RepID=A0A1H4UUF1_PSEAG|nr:DUF2303 family protein [Pseudomonas anguilliseptica]SEC72365.1 Uncharacterized conserved protein YfdQ, DUF2303 family [Pseudomonas anguilliseptica]